MTPLAWLVAYCLVIAAVSLGGGLLPALMRLTHKRMEFMLSFVAGAMLGVAVLHMVPHAVMLGFEHAQPERIASAHDVMEPIGRWLLAGFLLMFFIERFFAFHHHEAAEMNERNARGDGGLHDHHDDVTCDHHEHGARAAVRYENGDARLHRAGLTWTGAAAGLTIHSLVEGIALAASIAGESHGDTGRLVGLGTFLVIVLHKPFDALTLATLMLAGGRSRLARVVVNVMFSMVVPIGAATFWIGVASPEAPAGAPVVSAALAFSAGTFLCIALSDLLPELRFHRHDRLKLSAALLAGLAVAWGTAMLEARAHEHEHDHQSPAADVERAAGPGTDHHDLHGPSVEHDH